MALTLITADERLADANTKVSIAISGRAKIGKTTLVETLDPTTTLFCDFEAGMGSIQTWRGPHAPIRSYEDARDMACLIGGPDPGAFNGRPSQDRKTWLVAPQHFSEVHYQAVLKKYAGMFDMPRYKTVFFDSITELTRLAMQWAEVQPQSFAERSGKPDTRGAYGLLGREVVRLLKHVQHAPGKNVIFVGGLDVWRDDYGNEHYALQTEGNKTGAELPYIVDQVIVYSDFDLDKTTKTWTHNIGKGQIRALCCKTPNPWGLPAGGRFKHLDMIEEPHLGKLIHKINAPGRDLLGQVKPV